MASYNAYGGPTYKLPAPKAPPAPKAAFHPSNTVSAAAARGGLPGVAAAFPGSVMPSAIASGGDDDGGYGGYGGYQPAQRAPFDFNTDPGYLAALAGEQAGAAGLDASLRAARESALVNFGDPSMAGAFGLPDVSPLTAAMAQQATTSGVSTLAQLQRSRDQGQQTLQNQLAAHGLIRSGDLGWRSGQNQQDYGNSLYSAQQGVLDTLASKASDVASQKAGLHTNTVSALTNAYNTYVNDPSYYGMVDQTGASPPALSQRRTVDNTYPAATAQRQATPVATALAKPTTPAKPAAPAQTPYGPYGGPTYKPAPVSRLARR